METESEISQIWWAAWKEKLKQTDTQTLGYYKAIAAFGDKTRKRMIAAIEEEIKTRSGTGTSITANP
jgi:hypothetical protein